MSEFYRPHPFDPLVEEEIKCSSQFIRHAYPENADLDFRSISLYEPEKAEMIPFLEAEHSGKNLNHVPHPNRQARVVYYLGPEVI